MMGSKHTKAVKFSGVQVTCAFSTTLLASTVIPCESIWGLVRGSRRKAQLSRPVLHLPAESRGVRDTQLSSGSSAALQGIWSHVHSCVGCSGWVEELLLRDTGRDLKVLGSGVSSKVLSGCIEPVPVTSVL